MKNIFDALDYKFFQVFSGENRRIHAEIIMIVSDFFARHNATFVVKEDIVNHLTDYINQRNFDKVIDEEGNDISKSSSREKALSKLNLFKRNGWLIEEKIEDYVDIIQFDDNALVVLKALDDISNNSAPKEYTGYIYVIDNLLRYFDYNQGISILEQVYDNTVTLMNRLRGLNSSIKKYLTKLLNEDSEDAEKLLKTLLFDYQDNIVNKAFSNLKQNDNPSKYKNHILNRLNELKTKEGIDQLVANYRKTKPSHDSDSAVEAQILNQIEYVYDNIDSLQQTILLIDIKNAKYIKSSTSKLSFILSENYDVVGKVENLLRVIKQHNNEDLYARSFGLFRMGTVDSLSLYKPRVYRNLATEIELDTDRVIDQDYVDRIRRELFKDNRFSTKTINEFVKGLLIFTPKLKASQLALETKDDLTKLILIQLYAHHESVCYKTANTEDLVIKGSVEYKDFWIMKKGEHDGE